MKKILIVEIDKSVVAQIRNALLSENFDIIEASNGWDGWELAIQEVPDLIIANMELPHLSGIQFLKEMKKCPLINKIPFILIATLIGNTNLNSFILFNSQILQFNQLLSGGFTEYVKRKLKFSKRIYNRGNERLFYKQGKGHAE